MSFPRKSAISLRLAGIQSRFPKWVRFLVFVVLVGLNPLVGFDTGCGFSVTADYAYLPVTAITIGLGVVLYGGTS